MSDFPIADQVQAVVSLLGLLAGLVSAAWALTLEGVDKARLSVRDDAAIVAAHLRTFASNVAGRNADPDALMRSGMKLLGRCVRESKDSNGVILTNSKQTSVLQRVHEVRVAITLGALERIDANLAAKVAPGWQSNARPSMINLNSDVSALGQEAAVLKASVATAISNAGDGAVVDLAQHSSDFLSRAPINSALFLASMSLAAMSVNILGLEALPNEIAPSSTSFGLSPNAMVASLEVVAAALFTLIVLRGVFSVNDGIGSLSIWVTGVRTIEEALESFVLRRAREPSDLLMLFGIPIGCTVIGSVLFFRGPFLFSLLGWGLPEL